MIELKNIKKSYKDKTVFDNFCLNIEEEKVTAILGESGSGKTTLLNILAGLTDYEGEITGNIGPVSMVFQDNLLIPNLTVSQNLKLVFKDLSDQDISLELDKIGLKGTENVYPSKLSGGMARRVAILRGVLYKSPVLLMDEPFNSLNLSLKLKIINDLKSRQKTEKRTVLFVTHDIKEAVLFADRVIVISKGELKGDFNTANEKAENEIFSLISGL